MAKICQIKKFVFALTVFLVIGLLSHSIIFFVINKALNPAEISGQMELVQNRLAWRKTVETVFAFCSTIYCLGQIVLLCAEIKKKLLPPWRSIIAHFIAQVLLMLVCTVPFGILDADFLGDYLFPVWGTAGTLGVITAIKLCFAVFCRKIYCQDLESI